MEWCLLGIVREYGHRAVCKANCSGYGDEAKKIDDDAQRAEFYQFCAMSQKAFMVKTW